MTDTSSYPECDDLAVTVSDDGVVVRVVIDRPEKQNALSETVLSGLSDVLRAADQGPARVVVIRGAGGTFCSGGDLESMASHIGGGPQAYRSGFSGLAELMEQLIETSALVVAAVEGHCLAGGMGLAAACDIIIATADATFGTPEVDIGLFPAQALVPIMRTVQEKQALKLLFTGEYIGAETAHEIGFTSEVVPTQDFESELDELIKDLAASSPVMIEMGKQAFYTQRDMDFHEALSYMREIIALIAMSEETEAGINSFLMNEQPDWKQRGQ
ncbi:enoyl-CoA hydratase/isomerase family protein [Halocatena salina]|uniref:Enoyl-CoA hydratase-related protein n=1 Tax=Halocatena salina TaxID=2934340 RepID=A0A8U0A359_9EURY|nr:enoyl-CoA hydratase-related protein [Halocatena salina]UPM42868.1 enoyl-CoA hydratase-related protein [Halocatena salina]